VGLADNVVELQGAAEDSAVVFRSQLSRPLFHRFMSDYLRRVVAIEACDWPHRWEREMDRLGHYARLIAPRYVKPFIKEQKHDTADVEAA
jgi:transposase